jgi:predicted amidohydrolase
MKLVSEKYRKLRPDFELLTDEVVISQAWKKTHGYMRTHNWYADTLALDVSALGIEQNSAIWSKALSRGKFALNPLELVPAAKSEEWILDANLGWVPKEVKTRKAKPPIRPLAHLTVRDQTWATAAMMCLADAVESAQGNCATSDAHLAQGRKVYSYGNRLLCDWKGTNAWFRWGNGETYRKFFTDYQTFLKRPIQIGRSIADSLSENDHVFIINLDLSKFYDNIDRDNLITRLAKISLEYENSEISIKFLNSLKKITNWTWSEGAVSTSHLLGLTLGDGLPQGLVASGFFANAYMVPFDRKIGQLIGESITNLPGLILHDYCRYVDDLRLVVSTGNTEVERIVDAINRFVNIQLSLHAGENLKINPKKSKITSLSDLDNSGSLSGRIAFLQDELSGPADRDILENASAVLEGLLTSQPDEVPESTKVEIDKNLFRLIKFDHDIRLDTLKRFAANRLETVIQNKRKLTFFDTQNPKIEILADNESELLSKKLVKAWMQDPSLGLVLRKAIEIFPSPAIFEPVIEAIYRRTSIAGFDDILTSAMMDYLLADLFRCCVDFNGYFQKIDFPKSSSPQDLLDVVSMYAQRVAGESKAPEFVMRQALLFLATQKKAILIKDSRLSIQNGLHAILAGSPPPFQRQRLALFEVAAQITGRPDTFAMLLLENTSRLDIDDQYGALESIAKRGGDFWFSVWNRLVKGSNKVLTKRLEWASPVLSSDLKSRRQRLSKVIASEKNGFRHESALIKLALGLIKLAEYDYKTLPLSPRDISITQTGQQSDWNELWLPTVDTIDCHALPKSSVADPRFNAPPWIDSDNQEHLIIYWIGSILRASAVGGSDFTGNAWKGQKITGYTGLKTGWYKRRMGMMHSSEVLVGSYATVSGWFSELLMKCLQWPGFESTFLQNTNISDIDGISSLKNVLTERLLLLNNLYCATSRLPALVTSVDRSTLSERQSFRIVAVQQLLPRDSSFSLSDPTLSLPRARAENRAHLARICQLIYKTLSTKLEADNDSTASGADLIVFPEVAIHPEDQDLIKRLADKTKAIIFAGLIFTKHDGKIVNIARWYIPDYRKSGRQWIVRDQGKYNMTGGEKDLGITGFRPCQHIIEITGLKEGPITMSGAICYDATDLKLAVDLKNKSDLFVVCAHNRDVNTFDTMAGALNYHMYQHVVVVNKGEYGGSTIQAPYREHYDRLVAHAHGVDQISIHVADLDLAAFRREHKFYKSIKTKPAG